RRREDAGGEAEGVAEEAEVPPPEEQRRQLARLRLERPHDEVAQRHEHPRRHERRRPPEVGPRKQAGERPRLHRQEGRATGHWLPSQWLTALPRCPHSSPCFRRSWSVASRSPSRSKSMDGLRATARSNGRKRSGSAAPGTTGYSFTSSAANACASGERRKARKRRAASRWVAVLRRPAPVTRARLPASPSAKWCMATGGGPAAAVVSWPACIRST